MFSTILGLVGGLNPTMLIAGFAAAALGVLWLMMSYYKNRYKGLKKDYDNLKGVYEENLKVHEATVKQYSAAMSVIKNASRRDVINTKAAEARKQEVAEATEPVESLDVVDESLSSKLNDILRKK